MMFGSVSEHFANLRHVKRCKTCVSGLYALFQGTEVAKHPSYSIRPKMMFRSVSEHFPNLRHLTRCKTSVSCLNALFYCNEVAKHPFYSIRPKMMFGSVSEHIANIRHVKRCKVVFRAWKHYFRVTKLRSIHSTQLDPKWCSGVIRSISLTFGI
jgi:acid stress-induced BolA-like protein IbaG/YrbA